MIEPQQEANEMTTTTKNLIDAIRTAADLDQLLEAIQDAEARHRELTMEAGHQDDPEATAGMQLDAGDLQHALEQIYCDLPTWGPAPEDTDEIYSWDATRYLVSQDQWHLVPRHDVEDATDQALNGEPAQVVALLPGTQARRAERIGVTQQTVQAWAASTQEMSRLARHMILALLGYQVDERGQWARVR